MNEILLWRKTARIILLLSQRLRVSPSKAMDIFYASRACALLHNPKSGLQLMSDAYVADEVMLTMND